MPCIARRYLWLRNASIVKPLSFGTFLLREKYEEINIKPIFKLILGPLMNSIKTISLMIP